MISIRGLREKTKSLKEFERAWIVRNECVLSWPNGHLFIEGRGD